MKQCQSCGMPLQTTKAGDCRGSEKSGSKSEKWCSLCYVDGEFVNPNCTVEQMTAIVDDALKRQRVWWPMRFMAKKQIPALERWRGPLHSGHDNAARIAKEHPHHGEKGR